MATVTNAWTNDKPEGSEAANTTDDKLRQWRLDEEERLKPMFYGFDSTDNTAPNNEAGIKKLDFYKQASDPSSVTDYAHLYVKLVAGIPELFFQDDTNTTFQLTSEGTLNVLEADILGILRNDFPFTSIDQAGTGTVALIKSTTLDEVMLFHSAAKPARLQSSDPPLADEDIANKKYVDDQIIAAADPAYSGGESHTFGGGMIIKTGEVITGNNTGTVTFAVAFPNAIVSIQLSNTENTGTTGEAPTYERGAGGAALTTFDWAMPPTNDGFSWTVIGY